MGARMKNAFRYLVTVLSLLAVSDRARCESIHDGGFWTALFTQGDVEVCDAPLKWWFDGHMRFLDDADGFNQSLFRPGIGWGLTESLTVWGGYAWIHTSPIGGSDFDEHRIWQQLTWAESYDLWTFALRPRLEQRNLEGEDDVGLRFRQLVRLQRQLPSRPGLSLVMWDEIFYNLDSTDWGAESGFDQNRAFVGFGLKHRRDSHLRTEIGYMHQTIENSGRADRANHVLSVNFYY